jgi:hypothetical protein
MFVPLPLLEGMGQSGAGEHDQWRVCMTILVVDHGFVKSITILTAVIRQMIKLDVDNPGDSFRQEVKLMLATH